ncbi:MAG: inorganic pyrophosphatase Ppa [Deltaproteobacteria bacterium]|nr:inorganic pyrophosphatase Ppa [Deltaproteobacteria bacterium]MBW2074204.1 inorganic pyrophosphatase Ppa [Deltaproteobacteria bacterium]RLB84012.1 MAG: inorganic pyrophosphatase Ppa [Deltaproteobacteria bacterium]
MTIQKFLEKAKKYEVKIYEKYPDLIINHVPFTGAPQKHPYHEDKIILIADPFSTQPFYYEFDIADIEVIEELPSVVTMEGESVIMVRVWVRKGSIGVKSVPFVVEETTQRQVKVKSTTPHR